MAKKHVIILGAGASSTSGYPDAEKLRLIMSVEQEFRTVIEAEESAAGIRNSVVTEASQFFFNNPNDRIKKAIKLFREGGFGTVDEFSSLAHGRLNLEIDHLKRLLAFVLAIKNPEREFQKSDYYPFLQRLFSNDLANLRDDLAVLTFNYDSYLPFLVRRAYFSRIEVTGSDVDASFLPWITPPGNDSKPPMPSRREFCCLELHGGIGAFPDINNSFRYETLFASGAQDLRLQTLLKNIKGMAAAGTCPRVLFPWEAYDRSGGTPALKEADSYQAGRKERAQNEIKSATRISLVGLSMHNFLLPGFRSLLASRDPGAKFELVVANKEHSKLLGLGDREAQAKKSLEIPRSIPFRFRRLCKELGLYVPALSELRVYDTFREFLENEL